MNLCTVPFYKNAPFVRLILPFVAGILIQWTCNLSLHLLYAFIFVIAFVLVIFRVQPLKFQYFSRAFRGFFINMLVAACGCLCLYFEDARNDPASIVNSYEKGCLLLATLIEPLAEKTGSYKTSANVKAILNGNHVQKTSGIILIYFEKKPEHSRLRYGDVLIISAALQPVSNTGNPGAFDYRIYCFFKGIHHQVFLTSSTYTRTGETETDRLSRLIFFLKEQVLDIIKKFIPGRKEAGLAQALLIGYKDNLDKELVQSYSNTGVVHVIAISGLHLGLIYSILVIFTSRLKRTFPGKILQLIIITIGIWIFAIIAGASASVVRSAVMFTCIATGNVMARNLSVYNSLAASAFLLLCYNPFWLWDTGFLLSYAAVLSIVIYQKPVYDLLPFTNKILAMIWKTCAITLSAQILTTPVSLYFFHQFPNLFLITNFVAIPLSSVILILEIILCCVSFYDPLATLAGGLVHQLITLMNWFVELIDTFPFANWKSLQISLPQQMLLYGVIAGLTWFKMYRRKAGVLIAICGLVCFFLLRGYSFADAVNQQKLIVYNIPGTMAVELIDGRNALFIGDSSATFNEALFRFNIAPSRTYHRISSVYSPPGASDGSYLLTCGGKLILIASGPVECRVPVDILIISGNPRGNLRGVITGDLPGLVVFDSSNPNWRVRAWQQECRELNLPSRSVAEEGAFVMNLN